MGGHINRSETQAQLAQSCLKPHFAADLTARGRLGPIVLFPGLRLLPREASQPERGLPASAPAARGTAYGNCPESDSLSPEGFKIQQERSYFRSLSSRDSQESQLAAGDGKLEVSASWGSWGDPLSLMLPSESQGFRPPCLQRCRSAAASFNSNQSNKVS
jgi:hypothetical protein